MSIKQYKLLKDLPTFKAGDRFWLSNFGNLCATDTNTDKIILVYSQATLEKFPNILTDWFEEIPEGPKTVWDLEDGDECFYIDAHGFIGLQHWSFGSWYVNARECGNISISREEAEKEVARRKAIVLLERDTKGFKPDWNDDKQVKWEVGYNVKTKDMVPELKSDWDYGTILFGNLEDAQDSIKAHRKEWLIYLGVEEDDD